MGGSIEDAATQEIEPVVRKLKQAVYDAGNILQRYNSAFDFTHWKIIGITAFSSIAASLLIVWFLIPKPILPLTSKDLQIYDLGKSFAEVWPTLSKEKQNWILGKKTENKNVKPAKKDRADVSQENTNDIDTAADSL